MATTTASFCLCFFLLVAVVKLWKDVTEVIEAMDLDVLYTIWNHILYGL